MADKAKDLLPRSSFLAAISSGTVGGAWLLEGEEENLKDEAIALIREKYLPENGPEVYAIGQRVRLPIMGPGTVTDVDTAKGAHLVKFDGLDTPRAISFRAKLEKA